MKIRSQVGMVLNLDKCIGCHTCSVTCKNVWTGREGMEYAWFNNVETKPGIGYPKNWEDQEEWQGGWVRDVNGKIRPRLGSKMGVITKIFANPVVPQIDDYYEPFTFDYEHLHSAPEGKHIPTARPRSLIDGKRMDKVIWGPNWEELLGGEFEKRARDRNFEAMQKEMYGQFENTFMMYLPRLCEHCLNPSCVATCPSGAIYKREEDGIVLIDQDKCRGWRLCISGCPYKKIYFNWKSGKSEKCIFCYPRIESGQPTVCSETCVGRIRYLGVLLYDADRIEEAASTEREVDLYERQCEVFLDPHDPSVIEEALKQGIPQNVIEAAQRSPVYKMAMDWKLALPLHPEYRTLPMVWYVPPLSLVIWSNLFHIGILGIFFGHLFGMLTPHWMYAWFLPVAAKQLMAMVLGGICGVLTLIGGAGLLWRRLTNQRVRATSTTPDIIIMSILLIQCLLGLSTIPFSAQYPDGSEMMKLVGWAQSIVTFRGGSSEMLNGVAFVFRLHLVLGMTIFLLFPFTRLVHVWSAPFEYFTRRYQIVRSRR
ncbi:nitrate reductase subunit beta [Escherichia coli]|nr:nitrate reductase subunit beta [Escherichia coli]